MSDYCRSAPHCIEYAHLIQWGQERSGEEFDADNEEHMRWVFEKAVKRADEFGIPVSLILEPSLSSIKRGINRLLLTKLS